MHQSNMLQMMQVMLAIDALKNAQRNKPVS